MLTQAEENKLQQDVQTRGSPSQPPSVQTEHVTKGSNDAQEHHGRRANPTTDDDSPPDWRGGSEAEEDGSATPTLNNWTWGVQGRPLDYGRSVGVLAQRPNEPARGPRRTKLDSQDQRNSMWQNVQQVQQHMASAREEGRSRRR